MNIITDPAALRLFCSPVSLREGGEIARKLTDTLRRHNKKAMNAFKRTSGKNAGQIGVGLAAPQIGIHKQVFVLLIKDVPKVLMNPVMVDHSNVDIPYEEGCLSFPGQTVKTRRWAWVTLETLNVGTLTFGPLHPDEWTARKLLESVAAQHELDHLQGVLMFDRIMEGETCSSPSPSSSATSVETSVLATTATS